MANDINEPTTNKAVVGFGYAPREGSDRAKKIAHLGRAGVLDLSLQTVKKGIRNNLHMHTNCDEGFLVLKGRVRFYGDGHEIVGEYGPHEGVLIPAETPYWFEAISEEPLEIVRIGAGHLGQRERRVHLEKIPDWMKREGKEMLAEAKWGDDQVASERRSGSSGDASRSTEEA